mmetsp:Transcript_93838/g.262573  ORF Transcript_93838/g.262573 Transcript_93838/m.262573 type:complete len:207 (+) Transcript_93838:215-835(+)
MRPGKLPRPLTISEMVISSDSSLAVFDGRGDNWQKSPGTTSLRNQNFSLFTALILCARSMFSSTLDSGNKKSKSKIRSTRVRSTTNAVKAAFSKSVSCTSMDRNSVRQPMYGPHIFLGGGGFQRNVCQFVEFKFSKCSTDAVSSTSSMEPSKATSGSRTKRWAMCLANGSSMPSSMSLRSVEPSTSHGTSLKYSDVSVDECALREM